MMFAALPAVHEVLRDQEFLAASASLADPYRTRLVRGVIATIRHELRTEADPAGTSPGGAVADRTVDGARREVIQACVREARRLAQPFPRRVINGTGVLIHTNLGRAPLGTLPRELDLGVLSGYTDLEWDATSQGRGDRDAALRRQLILLTGAESALVVNNCAGALVLALATLSGGREVLVSRSELVEIGGSFRVPEIMEASGCRLREVGTTNRTRLGDYERAAAGAAAFLKVHQSNFVQRGFVEQVPLADLVVLGRRLGIPIVEDNGSGLMDGPASPELEAEPRVTASLELGVDIVCCSADKLFGSVQAGLIVGRAAYVDAMRAHPLYRALRLDKVRIALLDRSLKTHLAGGEGGTALWTAFHLPVEELERRARTLVLPGPDTRLVRCRVVPLRAALGGGTSPDVDLASTGIELEHRDFSAEALKRRLAGRDVPIVGYVRRECCYLDLRTVFTDDYPLLQSALNDLAATSE